MQFFRFAREIPYLRFAISIAKDDTFAVVRQKEFGDTSSIPVFAEIGGETCARFDEVILVGFRVRRLRCQGYLLRRRKARKDEEPYRRANTTTTADKENAAQDDEEHNPAT